MTTPTPDFRALCAELVNELHAYKVANPNHTTDLIDRARTALATTPPEPPTDDELWSVGNDDFRANCYPTDAIYFARAVLERWGTPAIAKELRTKS
jgi:hypothetical protein